MVLNIQNLDKILNSYKKKFKAPVDLEGHNSSLNIAKYHQAMWYSPLKIKKPLCDSVKTETINNILERSSIKTNLPKIYFKLPYINAI